MNPHIIQMDKSVFGQDADVFRPERWLESEERCKAMDRAYISFGVGVRPCAGKNVSCILSVVVALFANEINL